MAGRGACRPDLQQPPWEPWHPAHPRLLHTRLPEPRHPGWQHAAFCFASPFHELFASSCRRKVPQSLATCFWLEIMQEESPAATDELQKTLMAPLSTTGKSSWWLILTAGCQGCITTEVQDFKLVFRNHITVTWGAGGKGQKGKIKQITEV